jgi:TetR/AcrR family transcriptional regulator, cholesterol catabolism regulator
MIANPRNTREIVLKTATNLFYQKGYADTSIRDIGAKAGISNSIVYHYFKNKEELLFEIVRASSENLLATLREVERQHSDPVECLQEMLKAHTVRFSFGQKKEARLIATERYWLRGKRREAIDRDQRGVYDLYKQKLKEISDGGLLNEIDVTVLNFSILAVANGFYDWYKEGGRLSEQEVVENILKFVLNAVIRKRGSGERFGKKDLLNDPVGLVKDPR